MKKKKMSLDALKVTSFTTSMHKVRGGDRVSDKISIVIRCIPASVDPLDCVTNGCETLVIECLTEVGCTVEDSINVCTA